MDSDTINKMTGLEQLQTMEALWQALTHGETEPDSPVWHAEILEGRRAEIEKGTATYLTLEEVKADIGLPIQPTHVSS